MLSMQTGPGTDGKDRRRIRFGVAATDAQEEEIEKGEEHKMDAEQPQPSEENVPQGKPRNEFRSKFGLRRAKPQSDATQVGMTQEENSSEPQPEIQAPDVIH